MLLRALCVALVSAIDLSPISNAQTFNVIHTFTGGADGANPSAGVTIDGAGNLYGTANTGGTDGWGTVYRLKRSGSGWIFGVLHAFTDVPDGSYPYGGVAFGPDGALYGTTFSGGIYCGPEDQGCGTVFRLTPPATFCRSVSCPWIESVVYPFQGYRDGTNPSGDLVIDQHGNVYGTTHSGGRYNQFIQGCLHRDDGGCGTVYQLTPSGMGWTHNVLYRFDGPHGAYPRSGVTLDQFGNVYGTTWQGGQGIGGENYGYGVVYQLTPSTGVWAESVLHYFTDGDNGAAFPGGLIFDPAGNLYGGAGSGGLHSGGAVYELMGSMGGWNFDTIYSFSGPGGGPGTLTMDSAGNLYGATAYDGAYGYGSVFELTFSNGTWSYTSLHDFTGGSDGGPYPSNVVLDANGNLYGTTVSGGGNQCNCGVVWEITP
jgi:uncharacterized repeat protein (TIGR03803 family)